MIYPIYVYGMPVLRKVCEDITPDYPELDKLIENMFATMDRADGVGLAAPQIGKSIRVVVVDLNVLSADFPEYKGYRKAFINPHILEVFDEETDRQEEGCLSVPRVSETVERPTKIRVRYQDTDFNEHEEIVEGFLARCMQHEFDHLEGVLFIDHISPMRKTMIKGKLSAMAKGKVRTHYKVRMLK